MYREQEMNEVSTLNERIKNGSALYFYRATPFTEHGDFNYNGALKDEFFFEHLFSEEGKYNEYLAEIRDSLTHRRHKSILLIGNQGCGKTTFVHRLEDQCAGVSFRFFDFDKNTSHPSLCEYIEIFSKYLLDLLKNNHDINIFFYDLYVKNKALINEKINANNNIFTFFDRFYEVFISTTSSGDEKENFIKDINALFFNQILSLIILWELCRIKYASSNQKPLMPITYCLDNLDVLVNKEIIEKFFKEYFRFVRNIDSIIQQIDDDFIKSNRIYYNTIFSFIFSCRQHTWARVRQHYRHDNSFVRISTLEINVTDAFDKKAILAKREDYISKNHEIFGEFKSLVSQIRAILSDMDTSDEHGHNIYDLFDDDYRQCTITFEEIIKENPTIIEEYISVKEKTTNNQLYGARGIIYKAIFEKFKDEGIFDHIGVLDIDSRNPTSFVSDVRMILNYLHYQTYRKGKNKKNKYVSFDKIVEDFDGLISKDNIERCLLAMFNLGDDSSWNELIAFKEINTEKLTSCDSTEIFITKAGREYLSFIATHFEFFNTRVSKYRSINIPLFDHDSISDFSGNKYEYNFQEIIQNVIDIVNKCCERMSKYYNNVMSQRYDNISDYVQSPFVYNEANVLHSERIIHTHIRYIDNYRLYILKNTDDVEKKTKINKYLIDYISEYLNIGERYTNILTEMSTEILFPAFKDKINIIINSGYKDFKTAINI